MNTNIPTTDELQNTAELADRIVSNLKEIDRDCPNEDTLDDLEKQTGSIVYNLKAIADDGTDLDEIEAQLDRIIEKMGRVKESE